MKRSPSLLSKDELIGSFIVRQAELESLLETLSSNHTASNQHLLVIGRRGMGKTMLVHRVALAIEQDPDLASRWYPILLAEEAYNVGTAAELWLEALHQLARQTNDERWRAAHVVLRREHDNRRLHDLALARLLDFADERKVRLMIAAENLQDILGAQMPEEEGWVLRHTLLNEPRIMLLATATAHFEDIDQPKKAAYELFATLQLRRLVSHEIRAIWERLAGERLDGQAHRILEIFTGGNPRLLTVLAGFAHEHTLREFMAHLLGLVDEDRDTFKLYLEALPLDERRVFVAMCELWEPNLARAIGEVARFDVNKTSMLLGRLVQRGAVEIAGIKGRSKYYQICEPLYGIFHHLRQHHTASNRVASVIEFITRFYLPERVPPTSIEGGTPLTRAQAKSRELKQAVRLGDHDRALERLHDLAQQDPEALEDLVVISRDTLLQLAAARLEGVHEIVSTITGLGAGLRAGLEPLAFALAQELGHDVLAPYEVSEVAKDIRAELRKLRGPAYTVTVPSLAAAEDAPRRKQAPQTTPQTTPQPTRKKPRKPSRRRL